MPRVKAVLVSDSLLKLEAKTMDGRLHNVLLGHLKLPVQVVKQLVKVALLNLTQGRVDLVPALDGGPQLGIGVGLKREALNGGEIPLHGLSQAA